jgi:hypothetical protein
VTDADDSSESPEIEEVRRLLADARHTGSMPDDIAARMDEVLAGLADTSRSPADALEPELPVAPVVTLAAHRRRRAAAMLVAAAAIVVGGVVVAQDLPRGGGSASPTSAADNGSRTVGGQNFGATGTKTPEGNPTVRQPPQLQQGRLVVHPRRFGVDALTGQRLITTHQLNSLQFDKETSSSCAAAPARDTVLRALYRRAPAALVYRDPVGGSQVVDLYVCGTRRPVRSTTLPAP